ncbi:hypothetical protein ACVR0P_02090 [Streptococcus castoreus]|uniref:hypothetical protein n=1 Tax=Streptococcus castoreus TaxID=254786 RepID=UPI00040994D1|nr:hypothetical protein [Streptococcus castoreus]
MKKKIVGILLTAASAMTLAAQLTTVVSADQYKGTDQYNFYSKYSNDMLEAFLDAYYSYEKEVNQHKIDVIQDVLLDRYNAGTWNPYAVSVKKNKENTTVSNGITVVKETSSTTVSNSNGITLSK